MDELFGSAFGGGGLARRAGRGFSPPVDVYYCGDPPRVVVKVEVAGIDRDELGLEIAGRELTIAGQRRPADAEGRMYQQVEIEYGPFRRVVTLGADVQADAAKAVYEDGILRIELPLVERERHVRTVPIEAPTEAEQP